MQIQKINENRLEVILNLDDLKKNNMDLQSFMANSIESQDLFSDILNYANKETGFGIKNYEIIVETFSLPNKCSFILVITRIPRLRSLYISKNKQKKYKISKSFICKFSNFENLCMFCNSIRKDIKLKSALYLLNKDYYLYLQINSLKNTKPLLMSGIEFADFTYSDKTLKTVLDENAKIIIKDCAITTCLKYFV